MFLSVSTSHVQRLFLSLLLLVTALSGAWAQTTAVTFNSDVRYSQWIMDSRLPDFKGNTNQMGFPIYETNGDVKTNASTWDKKDTGKTAKNDYVAGLVAKAAIENAIYYGAFDWSKSYFRAVEWYTQNISDVPTSGGSLDNLNPSKMFFGLYSAANGSFAGIANANTKSNATAQLGRAISGLAYYNTNYAFGTTNYSIATVDDKDVTGGWFHKHDATAAKSYDNEMWCDGQYMGPALLAQLIANKSTLGLADNTVLDWDIVAKQFIITWNQLWNETDGLLYHAFTGDRETSISHGWSLEDGVYHSKAYWGRAVGWYFLGLVDVLEQMPSGNANYNTLKGYLDKLAAGVAKYQTTNGVWYQVMDEKSSALSGNYEEASCSAIFAAAYLKAIRLNLLSGSTTPAGCSSNYQTIATNAYQGCISQFMKFDNSDKAKVHLVNSCASAGLGGSARRSGERSYYINGSDVTKITNYTEGKPLGAFIMAATEYERLYQNGQNLKFTSDLAPAYSCNGTSDALTVKVDGANANNATYQWFKDGVSLGSTAQTASYIPTESGNYYCKANNSIQTCTAAVTVAAAAPGTGITVGRTLEFSSTPTSYTLNNGGNSAITVTLSDGNGKTATGKGVNYKSTSSTTINATCYLNKNNSDAYVTSKDVNTYAGAKISVADGYKFIPSSVNAKVATGANITYQIVVNDGTDDIYKSSETTISDYNRTTAGNVDFTDELSDIELKGDSYIKIYYWISGGSSNKYIVPLELTMTGSVETDSPSNPQSSDCAIANVKYGETVAAIDGTNYNFTIPYDDSGVESGGKHYYDIKFTISDKATCKVGADVQTADANGVYTQRKSLGTSANDKNSFTVVVIAEDGTEATYKVYLTRAAAPQSSEKTPTAVSGGTIDGTIITATEVAAANAGQSQTVTLTLPAGASASMQNANGTGATITSAGVLTYNALAAGQNSAITIRITAEDGSTQDYTVNVSTAAAPAPAPEAGEIFSMTVTTTSKQSVDGQTLSESIPASLATIIRGTVKYYNSNSSSYDYFSASSQLRIGHNSSYVQIDLAQALKNGDVIEFTEGSNQISFTSTPTRATTNATTSNSNSNSYTVVEGDGLEGCETLYIWRVDKTPTIKTLTITRPEAPIIGTKDYNTDFAGATSDAVEIPDGGTVTWTFKNHNNSDGTVETYKNWDAQLMDGSTLHTTLRADAFQWVDGYFEQGTVATHSWTTPFPAMDNSDVVLKVSRLGDKYYYHADITLEDGTRHTIDYSETASLSDPKIRLTVDHSYITDFSSKVSNGYTLKVSASGGTVSSVTADGVDVMTAATSAEGVSIPETLPIIITAAPTTGRVFKNWKVNGTASSTTWTNGSIYRYEGTMDADKTVSVKFEPAPDIVPTDNAQILFQMNVSTNDKLTVAPQSTSIDLPNYATIKGGTATLRNGNSGQDGDMVINSLANVAGSSASYVKIELANSAAFQAGDIISVGTGGVFKLSNTDSNASAISTVDGKYTIQASDILDGATAIYIWKDQDYAFSELMITRGQLKKDITRLSPKGGTVKNTLTIGDTNTPTLFVAPFTGTETNFAVSDFEIFVESSSTALSDVRISSVNNTPTGEGYRQVYLSVTANEVGTARVRVNFKGNAEFNPYENCYIDYTVVAPTVAVTGVTLNKVKSTIEVGATDNLTATVAPAEATNKNVRWTSTNESVATVSETGVVTGVANGNATIAAITEDGEFTAICDVTVGSATATVKKTATFTLEELQVFGGAGSQTTTNTYTHGGITLANPNEKVQGMGAGSERGSKVQYEGGAFTITPSTGKKVTKVTIVTDNPNRSLTSDPASDPVRTGNTYEYVYDGIESAITFTNNTSSNIYATTIIVEYAEDAAPGQKQLTGAFGTSKITVMEGESIAAPTLTVYDEDGVATGYTVSYNSSNTSVVTVASDGSLTNVGAGSAVITATFSKNGYVDGTATYNVAIYAYQKLTVVAENVQMNNTDAEESYPVVKVYAPKDGQNVLLTEGTDYTLEYSIIENNDGIIGADGHFVKNVDGLFRVGTAVSLVTAIPSMNAKETYHVTEGTAQISMTVVDASQKWKPAFTGATSINMAKSTNDFTNKKEVDNPVVYNGVDISDGFTFTYTIDAGGTGSKISSKSGNKFTLQAGKTTGTVTVTVTAMPNSDNIDQYQAPDPKVITFNIGDYKIFNEVSAEPDVISVYLGESIETPKITVKDESGTVMDPSAYTLTWKSSAPAAVDVNQNGELSAKSQGQATITVVAAAVGYEDLKVTFTVMVNDPAIIKISKGVAGKMGTSFTNGNEDLIVTLGGWNFPVNGKTPDSSITSDKVFNESWADKGTAASYKDADYPYFINYGGSSTNARSEDGNNPKPESVNLYNARIDQDAKTQILDPMFQVPCTGSFIKFEPKVNGTITARIYQNGAFTDKNGSYQYRPQSRVFVLDEAGKLIQSTPKLAVTTGVAPHKANKDDTKTLADYTWNLQMPSSSEIPCTEEMVKSHFGLSSFSLDDPNAVRECQLSQEVVQLENKTNAFPGAKGWVVMYPAPVRYTFNVKAGKTYYIYNFGSKIGFYGASFTPETNTVVDDVPEFVETANNTIQLTSEGHMAKVSLKRTFVKDQWNACVLPFSLNEQQVDAIFGTTYKKGTEDGTQILYFEKVEGTTVYYTRHAYNTIVAGKPFLIKPTKENAQIKSENMGEYPYVTIEQNTTPTNWGRTDSEGYIWTSDYNVQTIVPGDYYLKMSGDEAGKLVMREQTNAKVQAFRGFLKKTSSNAKVLSVAMYNMLDDADTPTIIENLIMDAEGNILNIPANGKVYNINGQVVSNDAKKLNSLPKGLYIVNGKKYSVK